jgi:hypothetical protein
MHDLNSLQEEYIQTFTKRLLMIWLMIAKIFLIKYLI